MRFGSSLTVSFAGMSNAASSLMRITPLGDTALRIEVGEHIDEATHRRVQAAFLAHEAAALAGVTELTPAYTTVTLFYDPVRVVEAGAPLSDQLWHPAVACSMTSEAAFAPSEPPMFMLGFVAGCELLELPQPVSRAAPRMTGMSTARFMMSFR